MLCHSWSTVADLAAFAPGRSWLQAASGPSRIERALNEGSRQLEGLNVDDPDFM